MLLDALRACTTNLRGLGTAVRAVAGMHVTQPDVLLTLRPRLVPLIAMLIKEFDTVPDAALANQLLHVHMVYGLHEAAAGGPMLPPSVLDLCVSIEHGQAMRRWRQQAQFWKPASNALLAAARRLQWYLAMFTTVEAGENLLLIQRPVDVLCTLPDGQRIALDYTQPWHVFANRPDEVMGPLALRKVLLKRMHGLSTVHVCMTPTAMQDSTAVDVAVAAALQRAGYQLPAVHPAYVYRKRQPLLKVDDGLISRDAMVGSGAAASGDGGRVVVDVSKLRPPDRPAMSPDVACFGGVI